MALSSITNKASSSTMSNGKMEVYTYTTTSNSYAVIATVTVAGLPGLLNTISVTTNDLMFKFEYTRDGITWYTPIEDYTIAKTTSASLSAVRTAIYYRVSVKPAVAAAHGSCTWVLVLSDTIIPPEYKAAFAFESLTVTNAVAVAFTAATMDGATRANITVEDNPVRVRWDGTAPTTSVGHLMQAGDSMVMDFTSDLWHFRAIATGANAVIRVTYSR